MHLKKMRTRMDDALRPNLILLIWRSLILNMGNNQYGFAVWLLKYVSIRKYEHNKALKFFSSCNKILDVGCGHGDFVQHDPKRISGMDLNPKNVSFCKAKGYDVVEGNALSIPYPDNSFDGAYCSHVIQVFHYENALKLLTELERVTKPGGIIVIATFSDHKRLWDTPETVRPYPPHSIRNLIKAGESIDPASSPTYISTSRLTQEDIYLIHPPLLDFNWQANATLDGISSMFGLLQHFFFIRKYWSHWNYLIKLRNNKAS